MKIIFSVDKNWSEKGNRKRKQIVVCDVEIRKKILTKKSHIKNRYFVIINTQAQKTRHLNTGLFNGLQYANGSTDTLV